MKRIEAVIRDEKLNEVKEALEKVGYPGMTVVRVEGHGRQKGRIERFRGQEVKVELLPKVKIEIVTQDQHVAELIELIKKTARTGEVGDGKIFVIPVEEVVRIRTGEEGESAI
ncbi:MAG: nitrogen regulator P-II GlnB [Peptococcaceae bacterium]